MYLKFEHTVGKVYKCPYLHCNKTELIKTTTYKSFKLYHHMALSVLNENTAVNVFIIQLWSVAVDKRLCQMAFITAHNICYASTSAGGSVQCSVHCVAPVWVVMWIWFLSEHNYAQKCQKQIFETNCNTF